GREIVVGLLERYGSLSARELSEMSGLTINQIRNRLRELAEEGAVLPTASAKSKSRRYELPKP
ncbi:MAG: winged helix-turn-helix domain-containing protein, partial [Coriobacteriales bacterium]